MFSNTDSPPSEEVPTTASCTDVGDIQTPQHHLEQEPPPPPPPLTSVSQSQEARLPEEQLQQLQQQSIQSYEHQHNLLPQPIVPTNAAVTNLQSLGPTYESLLYQEQQMASLIPSFIPTIHPPASSEIETLPELGALVERAKLSLREGSTDQHYQHRSLTPYPPDFLQPVSSSPKRVENKAAIPVQKRSHKKSCEFEGCGKQCSFNYEWETRARYCSTHKLVDMVDVKHKTCEIEGCSKQPYFNYENVRKGRFCATHKLFNMINVKHKSCEAEGCDKQPSFNYQGVCNGLYCSVHKLPGMINVKNKVCAADGCVKVPSYNFIGETKALYCSAHKKENMFDVISKRCEASGCMKRPSFNYEGQSGCRFCASHKLVGMVDIISRICEIDGCRKNASCNYEGLTRRRFCCNHKLPNMVNIIITSKESSRAANDENDQAKKRAKTFT